MRNQILGRIWKNNPSNNIIYATHTEVNTHPKLKYFNVLTATSNERYAHCQYKAKFSIFEIHRKATERADSGRKTKATLGNNRTGKAGFICLER